MECREVRRLADAFVSEQLLVETAHAIVAHVEQCPSCRAEIEGLRRLRAATRSAFDASAELQPTPEFRAALSSRLRQAGPAPVASSSPRWLTLAASVLLVIGSAIGLQVWSSAGLLELIRAAVGDHLNCAITFNLAERPIPLADAVRFDAVNQALQSVMPDSTSLPEGALEMLDRHSCVFEGRRFAHLVMRYKGEMVSLLVSADDRPGVSVWSAGPPLDGTLSDVTLLDGMHVTAFRQARHSVFVVSSLNEHDVRQVAAVMIGPVSRALGGA
jgi:anti-sigma factor RsiW